MNEKTKLLLIYGGKGLECEVSVNGANNLYRYLKDSFDVIPVFIDKNGFWLTSGGDSEEKNALPKENELTEKVTPINLGSGGGLLFTDGEKLKIDVAFPLLHGDFGEDGSIQGALESLSIPFFGCGAVESCICYDKIYTKLIAEYLGIPTAKWITAIDLSVETAQKRAEGEIGYPMFIKPARLGSSFGASPAKSRKDFEKAYKNAKNLGSGRVIIEELVNIKVELECVYFGSKSKEIFTKVGEIRCVSDFYDYDTKYKNESAAFVSSHSSFEDKHGEKIRRFSKMLKEFIGIRDLCRFDFFLDANEELLFNEINTVPGFTKSSLAPRLIEESGEDLASAFSEALSERARQA